MNYLAHSLFYLFSAITIASSIIVVANKRPTYSVLALAIAMLSVSGLFVLLQAYFVAVIQVLIYAGAILVLFLFVIMLLGVGGGDETREKTNKKNSWSKFKKIIGFGLPIAFFAELFIIISAIKNSNAGTGVLGTVEAIGKALFTDYLLPFELISGILLIGILGIVNLAQKELESK